MKVASALHMQLLINIEHTVCKSPMNPGNSHSEIDCKWRDQQQTTRAAAAVETN